MTSALNAASAPRRASGSARARPDVLGRDLLRRHRAATDHPHLGGRAGGELVQAVVAAEHQGAHASVGEDLGHHGGHPGVGDTDGLGAGLRRVGQRTEEVEDRRHPELAAGGGRVPQRRVEPRREAERDAGALDALDDALGGEVDDDAELLQQVGRAAGRGRGPVAVLDHPRPGARDHHRRHRRDVHRVRAVAPGAAGVDRGAGHLDALGVVEHRGDQPGDLVGRLPLGAQRDDEAGDLGGRRLAEHHLLHGPGGVLGRQVLAPQEPRQQRGPARGRGGAHAARPRGGRRGGDA